MPDPTSTSCSPDPHSPTALAPASLALGARCVDGGVDVLVWGPHAFRIEVVVGDGDGEQRIEMSRLERGYAYARLDGASSGTAYALSLDGGPALPDPASSWQPDGVHGRSRVVDHGAFAWGDHGWVAPPLRTWVLYELHVGTFTPEGTFDAVIPRLPDLAQLGVTAIELMPVAQFPGSRNWGYDGVSLFAVQHSYGGPEGLKRLFDAAHAAGIAVVLDVVYNHLGPEGNYLGLFGPYFSDRHQTPWGAGVNVDGAGSDEVRRFFIDNARQWVRDYHVDGLRLDAIHGIVDTSAQPFLAELGEAVADEAALRGAHVAVIAESDLNDTRVIIPRDAGGYGHDAQWSDDFHHALHTVLTGEQDGYYADFAGIADLADACSGGYVFRGQYSPHRGRRHGSDSRGLPGERFVAYAQNHDQVGNRLLGDRLAATLDADGRRLAAAAVLLAPFLPMLFMGEEYGELRPFPYFVSHGDPDLVAAVREGRRREFAAFGHAGEAPDPQSVETARSAILDWSARDRGPGADLLRWHRDLLRLRRSSPSIARMRPAEIIVRTDPAAGWLVLDRAHADERTITALGFGHDVVPSGDLLPDGDLATWSCVAHSRSDVPPASCSSLPARTAAVWRR